MKTYKRILASLILILFSLTTVQAEIVYYDTDNVGTPVAMWDENGKKVWEGEYFPFGEEYRISELAQKNDKRFIGKEKDKETGLTYFGARYMDEKTGRFITPDPVRPVDPFTSKTNRELLENPQRLNRYAYGLNNPYRYVDPDGEFAVVAGFAAAKLIAMGVAYVGLQGAATVAPEARGDINSAMVDVAKINASETVGVAAGEVAGVAVGAARAFGSSRAQVKAGMAKAKELARKQHNVKFSDGTRIDLKGRSPKSKGHYNKKTKTQYGFPHVHDKNAPGGVRNPTSRDYKKLSKKKD